jgi:hypothetical protein
VERAKVIRTTKAKLPTTKARARGKAIDTVLEREHNKAFPLLQPPSSTAKGTHFSSSEDEFICLAYCKVSEDATKGANRTGLDFWTDVTMIANSLITEAGKASRAVDSLTNRFQKKIQPNVLAFKPYHKQAMKAQESGWNEAMYEQYAIDLWLGEEGKPYLFLGCSKILKSMAKYDWESEVVPEDLIDTLANEGPMGGNMERPIGSKRAKADKARARNNQDVVPAESGIVQILEKMEKRQSKYMDRMEKRNELFLQFSCLQRVGRNAEADEVFKDMVRLSRPEPVPVPAVVAVVAVVPVPAAASLPDAADLSSDDELEKILARHSDGANAKEDNDYNSEEESKNKEVVLLESDDDDSDSDDSDESSDESSGGDKRKRKRKGKVRRKTKELVLVESDESSDESSGGDPRTRQELLAAAKKTKV